MPFLQSVLYVALLGVLSHIIGEALPRRWFHWEQFPFAAYRWEKNGSIYEKIHIQDWKDHMPDMSRIMKNMVPKRLGMCPTSDDVYLLIQETCVAETVHFFLCLLSPVIYFFWKNKVGIGLSCLVVCCNLPFIMIQRYNRPTLVALAARLKAREERKKNARTHTVC